jgi:hypothetical protein
MGLTLDFIEIGTSDFNTLLESCLDTQKGMSVEPLKLYLDNLPDKPNVQKINAAIVDNNLVSSVDVYYIDPKIINEQGLEWWMKGCNSIEKPHPFHTSYFPYGAKFPRNLLEEGLVTKSTALTFTYGRLLKEYDVDYVDYIKLDTEGFDAIILNTILDYYTFSNKPKPKKILFETNEHNDKQKSLEVCHRLISLGYKLQVGTADYGDYQDFDGFILYDCLATLS